MCGIAGLISNQNIDKRLIKSTLDLMKNRGPDNQNFTSFYNSKNQVALLHSRLNIIDFHKRSNQPMKIRNFTIVFNGEIYNFEEIKKTLITKNYNFHTNSDTEVLLNSFIEYGPECVKHFIGMWAFAIWNDKTKKLFISRDLFGEKPLYYLRDNKNFYFGSEIKYLKNLYSKKLALNKDKINKFLFLGYKSIKKDNETFFNRIKVLPPSTNLFIDMNLKIEIKKYYTVKINTKKNYDYEEIVEENKRLLINSIKYRLKADTDLAFCLSGGIDSGTIASIASNTLNKKINCFSIIDNDERYNELKNIKKLNKSIYSNQNYIFLKRDKKNFFNRIEKLIDYHDEPISTISYYLHSFLSEKISKNGFRISLSGTGSDEIYTGYYDHFLQYFAAEKNKDSNYKKNYKFWKTKIKPLIRNKSLRDLKLYSKYPDTNINIFELNFNLLKYSTEKKPIKINSKKFTKNILRNRMLNELFFETVPIMLKHDDLNSMLYSVENRSPFLDKNLFEFMLTVPSNYLIQDGYQKKILRDSVKDILTDDIRLNREKKGFNGSINSLIKFNKKNKDFIFDDNHEISEFIDLKKLRYDIDFNAIPNHLSKLIFAVINLKIFMNKNKF